MYILLAISLLSGILVGTISYYITICLDSLMDFGGIFHFLRVNAFKRYATEQQIIELESFTIDKESEETAITQEVKYRIYRFAELARLYPGFKLWICSECISIRIAVLLSFIASIILHIDNLFEINAIFAFPLVLLFSVVMIYKLRE